MEQIEADIKEWIAKVSKFRPELGGHAVCPYASTAKYKIIECLAEDIMPISGYDVLFYVIEDYFDLKTVRFWVNYYNEVYPDYGFFEDCADYDTFINGVQTNNGKYNLILAQPKQKLRNFREKLAKTDYYSYWDAEYLDEILEEDRDIL